jgi:hypothetical protein
MSEASASFLPSRALEKPRNSRLVMTPELPRAPRSMAEAAVFAASPTVQLSSMACSSRTAAPTVMPMLVPVSPSGTGNTFSSSTRERWLLMLFAPEIMASRRILPEIIAFYSLYLPGTPGRALSHQATTSSTDTTTRATFRPVACSTSSFTRCEMERAAVEMFSP